MGLGRELEPVTGVQARLGLRDQFFDLDVDLMAPFDSLWLGSRGQRDLDPCLSFDLAGLRLMTGGSCPLRANKVRRELASVGVTMVLVLIEKSRQLLVTLMTHDAPRAYVVTGIVTISNPRRFGTAP